MTVVVISRIRVNPYPSRTTCVYRVRKGVYKPSKHMNSTKIVKVLKNRIFSKMFLKIHEF